MDSEHRALMNRTLKLIETTRDEISRLHDDIELAQKTLDRPRRLLSRTNKNAAGRGSTYNDGGVASRLSKMNDIVDVLESWEAKPERPAAVARGGFCAEFLY
jgi:hypothetical protein